VRKLFVAITAQFPVAVRPSFGRRLMRAFVRVGSGVAILTLLIIFLGPQTIMFFTLRSEAKEIPVLNIAPTPLADYSVSDAPGKVITYFGYEFTVPWNSNYKEKAAGNGIVGLKFESGQNLVFLVASNQDGILTAVAKNPALNSTSVQTIFPDLLKRSAYDQSAALYGTTPASVHPFGSRTESTRGMLLLMFKALAEPGADSGIFTFDFPGKRGFQFGDPKKGKRTDLEIYDMDGRNLEFLCDTNGKVKLSQPELNRILSTLHSVPPKNSAASAAQN
jgi:hypothetical protein